MTAYIIESHHDRLVVIRQSCGFSVVVAGAHPAYRFATLKQAELALSGLKSSIGLHKGFKIREVKP